MKNKPNAKTPVADDAKIWLSQIQHYLARDKSVLLSYFETADECYLWTVTAKELRLSPLGIKQPDLDNLIDSYQQEIQQHLPLADSPAAKKLYQILVQPASDLVPKGSHVIVVADSKIYSVNFETLVSVSGVRTITGLRMWSWRMRVPLICSLPLTRSVLPPRACC